ncbi:protein CNPPD1 [Halyomorpha halys]|uniref:protein CNPPD1 n=1 Tax=Halyomorpha halys TaxID=286706 RepID=UPI0006D51ABB|nr:protein CNPPD1 [Halyomorpha halys]
MSVHSHQKKKRRESHHMRFRSMGDHDEFMQRITKTLYYSKLPVTERFSLPLSELAVELYSEVKVGRSLERLRIEDASDISRNACISPCSFVLAVIYLEQLKTTNPVYIDRVAPSELFLISLMVASKFLNDNGEDDDVLNSEWASSANLSLSDLNRLEKEFLNAIEWKVFVNVDDFWKKLYMLEAKIALSEGKKRGWFSYTELEKLLDQLNAFLLAQAVFTISAVCLASYTAGMLTVIGSTMVATHLVYLPTQVSSPTYDTAIWQRGSLPPNNYNEPEVITNDTFKYCSDFLWLQELTLTYTPPSPSTDETFLKENASNYNIFVSTPYYLLGFQHQWKQPAMYLINKSQSNRVYKMIFKYIRD